MSFGPVTYNNERSAAYAQIAYRPTLSKSTLLKNFECVYRWDAINHPIGTPAGVDERQSTIGVNYWINPSTVLKAAYVMSDIDDAADNDVFLLQWAMGF